MDTADRPALPSPGSYSGPGIPWHRRLSLRLALLFGVTILLFNVAREPLFNATWNLLYVDKKDTVEEVEVYDPAKLTQKFEEVLRESKDGALDFGKQAVKSFTAALSEQNFSFAWIAQDGTLAAVPEDIDLKIGAPWEFENGTHTLVVPPGEDVPVGLCFMENFPLPSGQGTFVLISIDPDNTFIDPPVGASTRVLRVISESPLLSPRLSAEETQRRLRTLRQALSIGVAVVLAALLGLIVAWFITRRLARLARDARRTMDEEPELSHLKISGGDEITSLALVLNESRARMAHLLKEVQQRDRTRREWIAQVSHDIRTPLTALAACIDRAEERTIGIQEPAVRTELSLMLHTAKADLDRLNTLTRDLLESARLDLDESLNKEELLPAELVRHTIASIRSYAQSQRVNIVTDIPRGIPPVAGDGARLIRAFENLVKNAIQHADEKVTISLEADESEFRFVIVDDGEGLPEKDGQVVLAAKGKNPNKQDSSGLGLLVTRKIVEAHGGSLHGQNQLQGGAKVTIALPLVDLEEEEGSDA